jgi:hypothetical protein
MLEGVKTNHRNVSHKEDPDAATIKSAHGYFPDALLNASDNNIKSKNRIFGMK